jgi:hypothetical protein
MNRRFENGHPVWYNESALAGRVQKLREVVWKTTELN